MEWYRLRNGGARVTDFLPCVQLPSTVHLSLTWTPLSSYPQIVNHSTLTHLFTRDFLLFLPDAQNLESILSYYNSTTVSISPEGDVHVSEDAYLGLGTLIMFLKPLFGSIILVARTPPTSASTLNTPSFSASPPPPFVASSEDDGSQVMLNDPAFASNNIALLKVTAAEPAVLPAEDWSTWENLKPVLIACVPSTGYFAAGALAGITSRTATAPIDRLKVYLIAQTKIPENSLQAIKSGTFSTAFRVAYRSTANAFKDLWAAGGLRSLYAGEFFRLLFDKRTLSTQAMG
jgi:solute carrier family 25 (mitochondrial phosphate transporter), member 23/24/25/41